LPRVKFDGGADLTARHMMSLLSDLENEQRHGDHMRHAALRALSGNGPELTVKMELRSLGFEQLSVGSAEISDVQIPSTLIG